MPAAQKELSGAQWAQRFPGSKSLDQLVDPFQANAKAFVAALLGAGCSLTISSTLRPPNRAWLMHFSTAIARNAVQPQDVPAKAGIDIEWVHVSNGQADMPKSRSAAVQLMQAYAIDPTSPLPALESRHTQGNAIDMSISWEGVLSIQSADGTLRQIADGPRNGLNPELHDVGATYGVIKAQFQDDPHWSSDGH